MTVVSPKGIYEIIEHEGIVRKKYKDSKGLWTIGIGHLITTADGTKYDNVELTLDQVFALFDKDLDKYEARTNEAFKVPVKQHEFDAGVSFDFNTGAIHRATWVKTFNEGNRDLAIRQIMNWSRPPEIIDRRRKEQALFANGTYTSDQKFIEYPVKDNGYPDYSKGKLVNYTYNRVNNPPPISLPISNKPDPNWGFWRKLIWNILGV